MPQSTPLRTTHLDRRHASGLIRSVRGRSPVLWLAARFLDRRDRDALLAAGAFVQMLADIVAGWDPDSGGSAPPGERGPEESANSGEETDGGAAPSHGSTSCACGAASLHGRVQVAHNVIAFVFEEQAACKVGRVEIESFAAVRAVRDVAREPFDELVDAWAALAAVKRFATRAAIDRLNARAGEASAQLVLDLLTETTPAAEVLRQGTMIAAFILRARQLLALRQAWSREQRCLISLEDLAACGLRDIDLGQWLTSDAADGHSFPPDLEKRCLRLMRSQTDAALAHLAAGAGLIESPDPKHGRALAAFAGCWGEMLLDYMHPPHVQAEHPADPPRAVRFRAWRHAIGRRLSPRLCERLAAAEAQAPSSGDFTCPAPRPASPRPVAGANR